MGSHSVTCHPTEVRIPPLPPAEAGRPTRFSDPGGMRGWVDLCYVKATGRELNQRPINRKSNALPLSHHTYGHFVSMAQQQMPAACAVANRYRHTPGSDPLFGHRIWRHQWTLVQFNYIITCYYPSLAFFTWTRVCQICLGFSSSTGSRRQFLEINGNGFFNRPDILAITQSALNSVEKTTTTTTILWLNGH